MAKKKVKIPFRVRLKDGLFSGQVTGDTPEDNSLYKVQLKKGEPFYIQAVHDRELGRITWVSYVQKNKLVAAIGKFIERHFKVDNRVISLG